MREDPNVVNFWRKQATWVAVGTLTFLVTSLVDYRWVKWGALPMYLAGIGFLVLTKFIGTRVYGAKSWLHIGPINFQPAQLAVISGVLVMALILSQFRNLHPMLRLILCGALAGAPMLLILLQPDLGETIIWVPVIIGMLFIGGLPLRYLISIALIGLSIIPLMVNFGLKNYQRARITAFIDPDIDPQGSAWAIGKGFKAPNTQVELGFLPSTAVHNDYIFSAIGEQWGFLGGVTLLGAFALLMLTCLFIAYKSSDDIGLLLCTGFTALIFTHVFQNIGMTIALMPITGVPLPLISYSGSFVLMIMFALGLVNSVWVHRKSLP
jgi:rod shape determining protein RodA